MSTDPSQKKDDLGIVFNTVIKENIPEEAPRVVTPQKQVPKADAPISHLGGQGVFDVGKAFTSEHEETGTIVSDRKHSRPSLGESLMGAWGEWLGKTKAGIEKVIESVPKVTVEEPAKVAAPETRKEIIAEAAEHAIIAPKDDHHVVVEKLRTMGSDTQRVTGSPVTITPPKPDNAKGTWAHHVDEPVMPPTEKKPLTVPDLRKTTIAPDVTKKITSPTVGTFVKAQTKEKPQEVPMPTPSPKVSVPFGIQKKRSSIIESAVHIAPRVQRDTNPTYSTPIPRTQESKSAPLMKRETPRVAPAPVRTEVPEVPKASSETQFEQQVVTHSPRPTPTPTAHLEKKIDERPVFHSNHADWTLKELSPTHVQTPALSVPQSPRTSSASRYTSLTWMILGGIVLLGVILAIALSFYLNVFRGKERVETPSVGIPEAQEFVEESGVETVTLSGGARASLEAFGEAVLRVKPAHTDIRILVIQGETRRVATAEEFLTTIGAHVSPSTLRALDDTFTAGSITTTETAPYLVFHTSRFDTLFAGLLAWESVLYTDLAPLFGTNPITSTVFKDVVIEGKPARILVNDAGLDTVVYGFINQNTVVITKNRDTLSKLFLEL